VAGSEGGSGDAGGVSRHIHTQPAYGCVTFPPMRAVFVELPAFARYRERYLDDVGFAALQSAREGRTTLRPHTRQLPQANNAARITAAELLVLRERLHLSRPILARYLRTNPRTLENWEQGRSRPNAQAALLIRMVEKFPDTVQRLQVV